MHFISTRRNKVCLDSHASLSEKKQTNRVSRSVARFCEISKARGRLWIEKKKKKVNITRHSLLQLFKAFLSPLCQRRRQFIEGDNTCVLQCQLDSACVLVDRLDILVQLIITRNNKKIITKKCKCFFAYFLTTWHLHWNLTMSTF